MHRWRGQFNRWSGTTIIERRGRMLSPDGYRKTFDAKANGYARWEGCGVVILKRLSDALRDKDRILSVIRRKQH